MRVWWARENARAAREQQCMGSAGDARFSQGENSARSSKCTCRSLPRASLLHACPTLLGASHSPSPPFCTPPSHRSAPRSAQVPAGHQCATLGPAAQAAAPHLGPPRGGQASSPLFFELVCCAHTRVWQRQRTGTAIGAPMRLYPALPLLHCQKRLELLVHCCCPPASWCAAGGSWPWAAASSWCWCYLKRWPTDIGEGIM